MAELLEGCPLLDVDPVQMVAASRRVRRYCGWHIAPSITETITLRGSGPWLLPSLHVTAVTSITDRNTATPLAVEFDWRPEGIVEPWSAVYCPRGVDITFTHGFARCPEDVRKVVADMLTTERETQSESVGPWQATYFGPTWKNDLSSYALTSAVA